MTQRGNPRSARLLCAAGLLIMVLSEPSWGLDVTDGRIKLTLHEDLGRFSLAWQTAGASSRFVPLLASEDPRTSMLSIVAGNKVYTMGESREFSEKIEKTPTGARFVWKSAFLEVTETFSFIPAAGSKVAGGVRIDLTLKNLSTQDIAVGARYLFDTYLGEASSVHFRTEARSQITRELALTPADKASWWVSPLPADPEELGFQVMLSGEGITVPDRVVFANWKRLTDSSWSYEASTVRTFSLLPYSVNDSAASQYYEPRTVANAGELRITLAMGKYTRAGFSLAGPGLAEATGASLPATQEQPAVQEEVSLPEQAIPAAQENWRARRQESAFERAEERAHQAALAAQQEEERVRQAALAAEQEALAARQRALRADLSSIDAILSELDAALSEGAPLSAERLAEVQAALKELSDRTAGSSPESNK